MQQKLILLLLLVAFFPNTLIRAQTCKGKVIEDGSNNPVVYANVFLEGSTIGTITDSTGHFVLNTRGHSSIPLIISCIGYETKRFEEDYISGNFIVQLKKKNYDIAEVEIKAGNLLRAKYLKSFKKEFLGETENGKKCEILNEKDLHVFFNKKTKTLHVNASKPIEIINPNLNYKIIYLLSSFKKSREGVKYTGYSHFIDLEQKKEKEKKKTEENRLSAYVYSRMHFIRCLYNGSLKYTYFKIADNLGNVMQWNDILFEYGNDEKRICCDKAITVYFEEDGRAPYMGYSPNEGKWIWSYDVVNPSEEGKYSWFFLNEECVKIENSGYYNPESITWYGDLAAHRIGDLLPYNFYVSEIKFKKEQK